MFGYSNYNELRVSALSSIDVCMEKIKLIIGRMKLYLYFLQDIEVKVDLFLNIIHLVTHLICLYLCI